jgi:rSAM/selenodomain-associated transferase 1
MVRARRGVVYVVAKAPRPGAAKTRLCPPLEPEQAARLARAFLLDCLRTVREAGLEARVICRDGAERGQLEAIVARLASVHVQDGAGLGAAMESAFRHGLADGYPAVAVFGSDCPTVPPAVLRLAFDALETGADVSLGPSEDGGYYLLAARAPHSVLFRNMAWSTATVAAETLARCARAGLRVRLLPRWYDVDDAASLARLAGDLCAGPAGVAPFTREALAAAQTEQWMAIGRVASSQ